MHGLFKILAIAALSITVSTSPVDIYKRDSPLDVTLTAVDNAVFKATVTNTGAEDLKLLAYGTLFDSAPVQKLNVFAANSSTASPFTGILRSVKSSGLADEAFVSLPAGATYETTIDSATVHDISSTGAYTFVAEGSIPYAKANSSDLSGKAVYFKSNALTVDIDGDAAAAVPYTIPTSLKRADVQSGCSSAQNSATTQALANCASLAKAASTAATSGSSSKFSEYFKTTSASTRSVVAARLSAIASECSSVTSGAVDYYCTDIYGYCESDVLAYTIPTQSAVINCPLYYSELTALTDTCHAQDQATTTLHELTHAPAVYSPGTDDYGYGYAAATRLSSSAAVLNADSYALYANAIYSGC